MISVKINSVTIPLFLVAASLSLVHRVDATLSSGGHHHPRLLKETKSAKTTKSAKCDSLNFTDMFVFGDSLSDQGNLASVTPGYPARAATNGNFTVEVVADYFGLELEMSNHLIAVAAGDVQLITGNNYAVATAEGGLGPVDTPAQVGAFMTKYPDGAPSDALYMVWVGANDVLALFDDKYRDDPNRTDEELFRDGELAARQVARFTVQPLIDAGAQYVVVMDAAAVGEAPFATIGQPEEHAAFANHATVVFNDELERALEEVAYETGTDIAMYHVAGKADFEQSGLQSETPCTIGFTGIHGATPAIPPLGGGATFPFIYDPECSLPDAPGFAFLDELHPTNAVHEYFAGEAIDQICEEFHPREQGKSGKMGKTGKSSKKGKTGKTFKESKGDKY